MPANLSSTGLSFVSKDSSFRSTDGTFTPGSGGRTVRSSVGSASSSSAGESVIDPEEEVTITNDARQMEGELYRYLTISLGSLTLSLPGVLSSKLRKYLEFYFAKLSKTNSTT